MAAKALYRREAPLTNQEDHEGGRPNIFLHALRAFVVKFALRAPKPPFRPFRPLRTLCVLCAN